jgi:hypothetical protein
MQSISYFFPHPESNMNTTRERVLGLAVMVIGWLASLATYKLYVPWSTQRTYDQAESLQPKG